jgi:hypothetical protein
MEGIVGSSFLEAGTGLPRAASVGGSVAGGGRAPAEGDGVDGGQSASGARKGREPMQLPHPLGSPKHRRFGRIPQGEVCPNPERRKRKRGSPPHIFGAGQATAASRRGTSVRWAGKPLTPIRASATSRSAGRRSGRQAARAGTGRPGPTGGRRRTHADEQAACPRCEPARAIPSTAGVAALPRGAQGAGRAGKPLTTRRAGLDRPVDADGRTRMSRRPVRDASPPGRTRAPQG